MDQILIISFWNPIPQVPKKGLFIFEQVNAVSKRRSDIVFLEVNILPAKKLFYKTITDKALHSNKVISINIYSLFWKLILVNPWLLYWLMRKYLKSFNLNPKIIHSNIIFPCAVVGYLLAKKFNAKHIISEHWSQIEKYAKHPIFKQIISTVYKNCKAIMPVSEFLAKKIRSVTENPNIIVIPNVIDTQLFTYIPKEQRDAGEIRFSCVAAWEKPKRLDLIITSLSAFAKNSPKNIILNVIGGGAQTKDFSDFQCPVNVTINWIGYISKPEIANFLAKTDIFLQASEIETFSIVTAEALSTGTPVLVSNVGALPEFINTDNGMLVENTLDAWISGLRTITEKKFDHQKIALEICGKYSPDSVAAKIESIYNNLLTNENL